MDEMGVDKVDRVVLAGAFGAHISPKHAMVLGMIPDAPLDHVTSAGNAAGTGARIALCNIAARAQIEATVHAASTRSKPPSSRAFRSISSTPTPSRTRSDPFPELAAIVTLPDVSFNTGGGGGDAARRRRRG
jgi:uncharacterized 2Fe-2S/4Fe-4S cluster protein (DUF4445 family)